MIILAVIITIGYSVRLYQFGTIPPGLNQDEATLAYDAFSLVNYGIERNGYHFPVILPAFGSGQSGTLAAYLLMPIIKLFGLNIITSKIIHLIFGLLSLQILYITIKKIYDKHTALLSVFLLSISPWHIMISRWGLDCNLFPALFLLGCCTLAYSIDNKKMLPISFSLFSLSLYTYGVAYLVVPIFLLLIFVYLFFYKKIRFLNFLASIGIFIAIALPLLGFLLINHFELPEINLPFASLPNFPSKPTYQANSTLFSMSFVRNAMNNLYSLINLLKTQNDNLIWNVIPSYGIIYLFSFPLIIIGFIVLIIKSFFSHMPNKSIIVFFWLLASVALATVVDVNVNRINIIFIPLIILIALALKQISNFRVAYITILIFYCVSFVSFSHHYFTKYSDQIGPAFFESLGDTIIYADAHSTNHICITKQVNMPELAVLFYLKIDPKIFHNTVTYFNPGDGYQQAQSFGRFIFGLENCNKDIVDTIVIHNSEVQKIPEGFKRIKQYKNYSVATRESRLF